MFEIDETYLNKVLVEEIGEAGYYVCTNFEKLLAILYTSWQQQLLKRRKSNAFKYIRGYRIRHRRHRPSNHQRLHHLRVQLRHLKRHYAAVAEPHHRAPLHPQLSQPLHHTPRLEPH